jgi:hypothetical protein
MGTVLFALLWGKITANSVPSPVIVPGKKRDNCIHVSVFM